MLPQIMTTRVLPYPRTESGQLIGGHSGIQLRIAVLKHHLHLPTVVFARHVNQGLALATGLLIDWIP